MKYSAGYKYILREKLVYQCRYVIPGKDISTNFISLSATGLLTIEIYYASDGPSGPTIDTKSGMRGSFIHDALFQLMRFGLLNRNIWFHPANKELYSILLEDKMFRWRAWLWYNGVDNFSKFATDYNAEPKILTAP